MSTIIYITQIIFSLILIALIMIQPRGMGLGGGGGGESLTHSPKGVEKAIFISTIVVAIIFVLLTLANLFSNRI